MKNLNQSIVFLIITTLLIVGGCHCKDKKKPCTDPTNPDCENYDPCYGKKTVNTFFRVRPGDNGFPPPHDWCDLIPTDTFNVSSVRFDIPVGNPANSTYEWQIGSEPDPRTGKSFEVDFSEHLNAGNWEGFIPITLTIRTPMNECLHSEEETVKVVKRDLFFTEDFSHHVLESRDSVTIYRGYFSHEPDIERTLEFVYVKDLNFRGVRDFLPTQNFDLLIGLPSLDSIWWNMSCLSSAIEVCRNYKHRIVKYYAPSQMDCFTEATGRITQYEIIRLSEKNRILRFEFIRPNTSNLKYEFIGTKI